MKQIDWCNKMCGDYVPAKCPVSFNTFLYGSYSLAEALERKDKWLEEEVHDSCKYYLEYIVNETK
jgi:hypothetical protein